MIEPLIILLDVIPVLAIVCIPFLGDGPPQHRPIVRPGKR